MFERWSTDNCILKLTNEEQMKVKTMLMPFMDFEDYTCSN